MKKIINKQNGFTIVELMVGIVIGLLVVMAATGGASFYEANRRSTIGGNGAQENAAAAAFHIQKHARMAGMWSAPSFACPSGSVQKFNGTGYSAVSIDPTKTGATAFIEEPIKIETDGDSAKISVSYANNLGGSADGMLNKKKTGADFAIDVKENTTVADHFKIGDIVLLAPPSTDSSSDCTMGVLTSVHAGKLQMRPYKSANAGNGTPSDSVFDAFEEKSRIYNLGSSITHTLKINNNNFEVDGTPVAENVVKLLARIASDSSSDGKTAFTWPPSNITNQSYLLQLIVVGRSPQREKPSSGNANDSCDATTSNNLPKDWAGNNITIENSADETRKSGVWQCYRYRAIQIEVPLKNLILQSVN